MPHRNERCNVSGRQRACASGAGYTSYQEARMNDFERRLTEQGEDALLGIDVDVLTVCVTPPIAGGRP